ncbi:dTDP-4-dehydrorhamnose 3,5-epimerase family protein [Geothrix sp. 21YS21S-2]|uniref:dTDP-4-dehydrorhamnose 3,5-epimerase family protein n=1 Tax=Geothrix sp. 21YS21S-2 TaxID=3068893 RepID=UPI0027BACE06|nr:dTDP-4-dehydrorhamnose 3,5-epimerase family protein [Geothrix sp. 21YS21S-2]
MTFTRGIIEGVVITPFRKFIDERGWLAEIFRHDELPAWFRPEMCYVSVTHPGVLRGPHEHVDQADLFCWVGPGDFKLTLWDNRPSSPTFGNRMEVAMGLNNPGSAIIPKGVVHCYRCISHEPGLVINCPDRLFMGDGKKAPVDEIRHEDDPASPFVLDERARRAQL